jgi:hypothetical protein
MKKLETYFATNICQMALLYFDLCMIISLSKLNLHNSLIQRLAIWFGMKVRSFNVKNQILIIGFERSFRFMIIATFSLKIDKNTVEIYLGVLREFHPCYFRFSE